MKTMYMTEEKIYADCEGRHAEWWARTDYTTYEEAKEVAKTIVKKDGYETGCWRIMARSIDEASFTVKDEVIEKFDWWQEIGRKEYAKNMVEAYSKALIEANAIKARTENGKARKAKKIAEIEATIAGYKAIEQNEKNI